MVSLPVLRVQLADPLEERRFRLAELETDHTRAQVGVGLMLVAIFAFSPSDFASHGGATLFEMVALRVVLLAAGAALVAAIGRIERPVVLDGLMLVWSIAIALVEVAVIWGVAGDYFEIAVGSSMIILYFYTIVPNRLSLQCAPAALVTLGGVAFVIADSAEPRITLMLVPALLFANLMGFAASWQLQRTRRQHYVAWAGERRLRAELEAALGEVRELRGILPICAECKRIRDGEGGWQSLEDYLREREVTQFSHGICPQCLDRVL